VLLFDIKNNLKMCLWEKPQDILEQNSVAKASSLPLMDFSVKNRKRLQYAIRAQKNKTSLYFAIFQYF